MQCWQLPLTRLARWRNYFDTVVDSDAVDIKAVYPNGCFIHFDRRKDSQSDNSCGTVHSGISSLWTSRIGTRNFLG